MKKTITKEEMALLKETTEMFNETGCVLGIDGEQVPAERIVPEVKQYISETIGQPGSNLRSGDMGHTWIYTYSVMVGAKMASKMPEARASPQ